MGPGPANAPSRILMDLHVDAGGDCIARAGGSLSEPGRDDSFVSLNRLGLPGWSRNQDAGVAPDLKRQNAIRVNWWVA